MRLVTWVATLPQAARKSRSIPCWSSKIEGAGHFDDNKRTSAPRSDGVSFKHQQLGGELNLANPHEILPARRNQRRLPPWFARACTSGARARHRIRRHPIPALMALTRPRNAVFLIPQAATPVLPMQ